LTGHWPLFLKMAEWGKCTQASMHSGTSDS
jgi:hypothetical protein